MTEPFAAASVTATAEAPGAEGAELDEAIRAAWQATITAVNGRKRMLGAFLEQSKLVGVAAGELVLAMDDLHRSVLDAPEARAIVQEELARSFGRALRLQCMAGAPETPEQRAAKADSLKPIIDRAMQVFDGEVIERGEKRERGDRPERSEGRERPDRAGRGGERST